MLCPNCGINVGDSLQLCAPCAERERKLAKKEAISSQEELEAEEITSDSDLADAPELEERVESSKQLILHQERNFDWLFRSLIYGLSIVVLVLMFKIYGKYQANQNYQLPAELAPPVKPAEGFAKLETLGPKPVTPPEISFSSSEQSKVRLAKVELKLRYSLGFFWPNSHRLDLAFFDTPVADVDESVLRNAPSLENINNRQPTVLLSMVLRPDVFGSCKPEGIENYTLTFFKQAAGLPLLSDRLSFMLRNEPGKADARSFSKQSLECTLADLGDLKASFQGSRQISLGDETHNLAWELESKLLLIRKQERVEPATAEVGLGIPRQVSGAKVSLSEITQDGWVNVDGLNVPIKAAVAMYFQNTGDLGLGFYPEALSESEILFLSKKKTFAGAINGKRPIMLAYLKVGSNKSSLEKSDVKALTLFFYPPPKEGDLSNTEEELRVKRLISEIAPKEVLKLAAAFSGSNALSVELEGKLAVGEKKTDFSWHLPYQLHALLIND